MRQGSTVAADTGGTSTATETPVIASFSTDSAAIGDGITNDSALSLAGTGAANGAVRIYDGTKLLGSAQANGSGAWTFATPVLADGTQ